MRSFLSGSTINKYPELRPNHIFPFESKTADAISEEKDLSKASVIK
ncbi:hypothetical protein ES708_23831 [subsurface metagenome]